MGGADELDESSTQGAVRDNQDADSIIRQSPKNKDYSRPIMLKNPYKQGETLGTEISRMQVFSDEASPGLHPNTGTQRNGDKRGSLNAPFATIAENKVRKNEAVKVHKRKNSRLSKKKHAPGLIGMLVTQSDPRTRAKMQKLVNFWHRKPTQRAPVPNVFIFHSFQKNKGKTEVYEEKDHSAKHVQGKGGGRKGRGGVSHGRGTLSGLNGSAKSKHLQSLEQTPVASSKYRPKLGSLVLAPTHRNRDHRDR